MKNTTDITILVDRSGPMDKIRDDMIGGLNALFEGQKKEPGDAVITLLRFDTPGGSSTPLSAVRHFWGGLPPSTEGFPEVVFEAVPQEQVRQLTADDLVPRGGTALVDAACLAIDRLGERLASLPESERPARVLFAIVTDGEENSSTRFKRADLFERIKRQQDVYKWSFVFLGSNQDAIAEAASYGIPLQNSMTYDNNAAGVRCASAGLYNAMSLAKSGQDVTL